MEENLRFFLLLSSSTEDILSGECTLSLSPRPATVLPQLSFPGPSSRLSPKNSDIRLLKYLSTYLVPPRFSSIYTSTREYRKIFKVCVFGKVALPIPYSQVLAGWREAFFCLPLSGRTQNYVRAVTNLFRLTARISTSDNLVQEALKLFVRPPTPSTSRNHSNPSDHQITESWSSG